MIDILWAHSQAHRLNKPPYFFSHFKFIKMKEKGNTHYCCVCINEAGFKIDKEGKPTNFDTKDSDFFQKNHDAIHEPYVIKNADKYEDPWSWLSAEIKDDFPYFITIPNLP